MAKRQGIQREPTDLFRKLFQRAVEEPYTWGSSAAALMRAARALLPTIESDGRKVIESAEAEAPIAPIYMLLVGLALENLAKGLYVARNPGTSAEEFLRRLKTPRPSTC